MIIHFCQQGSDEWHWLRSGILTSSRFDQVLTPKTLKLSASAFGCLCLVFAERHLGALDEAGSQFMGRGQEWEPDARAWYAWEYNIDVQEVGFVTNDAKTAGCSPDGLVGDSGGLEIKIPGPKQHIAYLLEPQRLVDAYKMQVQGCLWVCEREWWDIISYHPAKKPAKGIGFPVVVQRVERDEPLIEKLAAAVAAFNEQLNAELVKHGYKEPPEQEPKNGGSETGNESV